MSVVVDLKPCPFCGGKGALEPHFYEGYDEEDNLVELVDYFVHCTKCGVSTPFLSCEETAQDAWEERYVTPSADGYTSPPPAAEPPLKGKPKEKEAQVCCDGCEHLERVNGRIVDARCKVTGIAFPKYATDKAMISPSTFSCSEGIPKGGRGT